MHEVPRNNQNDSISNEKQSAPKTFLIDVCLFTLPFLYSNHSNVSLGRSHDCDEMPNTHHLNMEKIVFLTWLEHN